MGLKRTQVGGQWNQRLLGCENVFGDGMFSCTFTPRKSVLSVVLKEVTASLPRSLRGEELSRIF